MHAGVGRVDPPGLFEEAVDQAHPQGVGVFHGGAELEPDEIRGRPDVVVGRAERGGQPLHRFPVAAPEHHAALAAPGELAGDAGPAHGGDPDALAQGRGQLGGQHVGKDHRVALGRRLEALGDGDDEVLRTDVGGEGLPDPAHAVRIDPAQDDLRPLQRLGDLLAEIGPDAVRERAASAGDGNPGPCSF